MPTVRNSAVVLRSELSPVTKFSTLTKYSLMIPFACCGNGGSHVRYTVLESKATALALIGGPDGAARILCIHYLNNIIVKDYCGLPSSSVMMFISGE